VRARKWYPTVSLARENLRRPLPLWWRLKMRKWVFSHKIWVLFKWLLFLISVQLFGSHGGDPHFFESQMLWVQVSKVGLPNVGYEHFTTQVCKAPSSWIPSLIMGCYQGWKRAWQPTPVFLPGESHGQRSLVGYSPWGFKELDMPEHSHVQ